MPASGRGRVRLEVRRIGDLPDDARRTVEAIYVEAFTAAERVPFADLQAADATGRARLDAVREGRATVAMAVTAPVATAGWRHLQYIAVDARRRGSGIGAAVWEVLTARLREEGGDAALLLEIENPFAPGLGAAERRARERRLRFYTRLGARLLRVPGFAVPDLADAGGPPVPMLLMAAPGRRAAMPAEGLRSLVADLYRTAYGLDPDHPLAARALGSVR